MAGGFSLTFSAFGFGLAFFGAPAVAARPLVWFDRRGGREANELLLAWCGVSMQEWQSIDGGALPMSLSEATSRLDGRSDDLAVALLISVFWRCGERPRASAAAADWRPSDPSFQARRERLLSMMAFDSNGTDDVCAARAAVDLIGDPVQRETQQTELTIEQARRLEVRGKNPFGLLAEARRALGPLDLDEVRPLAGRSMSARIRRGGLGCLIAVAHVLVVFGLGGLLQGLLFHH